jgi:hypothetical protein
VASEAELRLTRKQKRQSKSQRWENEAVKYIDINNEGPIGENSNSNSEGFLAYEWPVSLSVSLGGGSKCLKGPLLSIAGFISTGLTHYCPVIKYTS